MDIKPIRKRVDATIPGPWGWYGNVNSDQIYLATRDRGRLILLSPHTRCEEYVFDHEMCESYTLPEARERYLPLGPDAGELTRFFEGDLDREEGRREYIRDGMLLLTRNLRITADLQFAAKEPVERQGGKYTRNQHGGERLVSYREIARYEVLGGKTLAEDPGGNLYRKDIVGLDNPEAELIAHARDDLAALLEEVDRLRAEIARCASEEP